MRADGPSRRTVPIAGAARRVAVCIARWNPISEAVSTETAGKGCLVRSTHVTSHPARRSHAAGDARPNGWRPNSYVLIKTARLFMTLVQVLSSEFEVLSSAPSTKHPAPSTSTQHLA